MPVKQLWNVLDAQPCLFLMQIKLQNAVFGSMIIINKHIGQVSFLYSASRLQNLWFSR